MGPDWPGAVGDADAEGTTGVALCDDDALASADLEEDGDGGAALDDDDGDGGAALDDDDGDGGAAPLLLVDVDGENVAGGLLGETDLPGVLLPVRVTAALFEEDLESDGVAVDAAVVEVVTVTDVAGVPVADNDVDPVTEAAGACVTLAELVELYDWLPLAEAGVLNVLVALGI